MIHIVFSTWEQGFETQPALCTEKTGFHRVHQTLGSYVRSVEAVKTLASVLDRTLGHLVIER